jgi:hypothetical protein
MQSIINQLITDLRALQFSTYVQDRHIKGHSTALLKRLESLQDSKHASDKDFVTRLQELNPQDND